LCRLDSLNQATTDTVSTAETETFSLETPLVVKKGDAAIIKVYADYKAGIGAATENFIVKWKTTDCLSGTGASTGQTVSDATCDTGAGQAMTYAASGTLTSSWGNNPTANENVVAGGSKVLYGDYKFVASNENVILKTVAFTRGDGATGVTGADANFGQLSLYRVDGTTEKFLQSAYIGASSKVTFDLEAAGVPTAYRTAVKDATVKLRLYADLKTTTAGATSGTSDKFTLAATTDVTATGGGSGSAINASATVTGSVYKVIRKSVPTLALATTGLSTNLGNGTAKLIQFTITADAANDVAFKKLSFDLTTNDASGAGLTLGTVGMYTSSDTSTPITMIGAAGSGTATTCADGAGATVSVASTSIVCAFSSEQTVTAGTSKTYYIQGTVGGSATSDSIVVKLSAEETATGLAAATNSEYVDDHATGVVVLDTALAKSGTETNVKHIWSDLSSGASHSDSTADSAGSADWTGGYLLKTLPSDSFSISRS
ncbi:hypothetical protein HZC20_01690, partial [Candidatus Peregrinibacteria bacterium]|nr:hypothetical protein [Candidatus Peregrinibacteria bacterium]